MTESYIAAIIGKDCIISGHKIVCANVSHLFSGQMDVISVNTRGIVIEYEIKISRSDFQRDKRKAKRTRFEFPSMYEDKLPNKFYYVVPAGLIKVHEIPNWAGLIYITEEGSVVKEKTAPIIHKFKHDTAAIFRKVATLYQQREFLGCCLLTYNNRDIIQRNKERLKQYETQRQINAEALASFKKK